MRRIAGLGCMVFGPVVALLGIALMVVLGTDGSVETGPHPIETDGVAVVTAPSTLSWAGVRIGILAELPVSKPVFVGLGNSVDVKDYLGETARLRVDSYERPWQLKLKRVDGKPNLPAAPTALNWWIAKSAGLGGASIAVTLPDETVSLAILAVGASNLAGLEVTASYLLPGGFGIGIGLLLIGAALFLLGHLVKHPVGVRSYPEEEYDEDFVYVYVDDDGVEHEIDTDEVGEFEVIDRDERDRQEPK